MAEKTTRRKPFEGKISEEAASTSTPHAQKCAESIKGFLPPEFVEHRRAARKEMLLAWRSMIDSALKHMEEKE